LGDIQAVFKITEYFDDDLLAQYENDENNAKYEFEKDFKEVEALEKERAERLEGKGDTLEDLSNLEAEKNKNDDDENQDEEQKDTEEKEIRLPRNKKIVGDVLAEVFKKYNPKASFGMITPFGNATELLEDVIKRVISG